MKEITKLDDKYVVIKTEDLDYFFSEYIDKEFYTKEQIEVVDTIPFNTVLKDIYETRKVQGKSENHYVVLNQDDELNINYLISCLLSHQKHDNPYVSVKDIAVDLVNAILIAGNP